MRVLVVGAGAVGGLFGAKLALAGNEVTLVARGAHGEAIAREGLAIETPDGVIVAKAPVIGDLGDAPPGAFDLVLVAVKNTSLEAVAKDVGRALGTEGVAIPLQNGLDSERVLADAIGGARVVGGVARMAAGTLGPGRLYLRAGGALELAPLPGNEMAKVEALAERCRAAAIPCSVSPDLALVLYRKLLWNGPFNGVCALTRKRPGALLAIPSMEALIRRAMHEILEVARAEGVTLGEEWIDTMIDVSRVTFAETEPSMLQDVLAGRENEVEALQGAISRRGREHHVDTPVHDALAALLRAVQPSP